MGQVTHGQAPRRAETPLYRAWKGMRTRCSPEHQERRPTYAGVSCDPRWESFEGFRDNQPAGRPFEPGLHLARFGDTGDYTPENCRWATKAENTREFVERRMPRLPDGRFVFDVAKANGISQNVLRGRLRRGWDPERAATEPPPVSRGRPGEPKPRRH